MDLENGREDLKALLSGLSEPLRLEFKVLFNTTGSKLIFSSKKMGAGKSRAKGRAGGEQCPPAHGSVSQAAGFEP